MRRIHGGRGIRPGGGRGGPAGPRAAPSARALGALLAAVLAAPLLSGALVITATDGTISTISGRPSDTTPNPVLYSTSDGITFSSSGSNVDLVWYAEFTAATNNSTASSATIQGTSHTFKDWLYAMQGGATKFTNIKLTGVYDSDAGSYSVPLLFTKSSQGTLAFTSYSDAGVGPTSTTYYWAYNSGTNRYVIGTSKNLASETQLAPVSDTLGLTYTRTLETNTYVITAVAGAGSNYVPTVQQGRFIGLLGHPDTGTWYALTATPSGVHEDTYTFTLQATSLST